MFYVKMLIQESFIVETFPTKATRPFAWRIRELARLLKAIHVTMYVERTSCCQSYLQINKTRIKVLNKWQKNTCTGVQ